MIQPFIHYTKVDLMPGVPLYVYAVKGEYYSLLIDTGINQMREQVLNLCKGTGSINSVAITHVHADHIGCNSAVKEFTHAKFYASGAVDWIENYEIHYNEFCIPSEHLPDSELQRAEILGLMDSPVHVDYLITPGFRFRPSDNIDITTLALPGHKLEEVGFLEMNSGTLFMGDVLLALAAPFFHGFQTARGFKNTLNRLQIMIEQGMVKTILAAHHPPLNESGSIHAIVQTKHFLNQVEEAVVEEANGYEFPDLWKKVCSRLNKKLEFRGYAMLEVQIKELVEDGILLIDNMRIIRR